MRTVMQDVFDLSALQANAPEEGRERKFMLSGGL